MPNPFIIGQEGRQLVLYLYKYTYVFAIMQNERDTMNAKRMEGSPLTLTQRDGLSLVAKGGDSLKRTVKEVADLTGISVRTLHYYDEIGLLAPAETTAAGYRLYSESDLDLLQQILFYRELDMPLKTIKEVVHNPAFDSREALESHRSQLLDKRRRIDRLIETIDKTIQYVKGEKAMTSEEKFEAFKEKWIAENEEKFGEEIREKYGEERVEASNAKFRGMSQADFDAMAKLDEEVHDLLEKAYATGDPTSDLARELVEKHKEWLMYSWSDYSAEAHAGLADMYVADERFTAYYDKRVKGGTAFLRDAIHAHAGKA